MKIGNVIFAMFFFLFIPLSISLGILFGFFDFTTPKAPTLVWSVGAANDRITIIKSSASDIVYASSATTANLVFKNSTGESFVADDMSVTTTESGLEIGTIDAGDQITGFDDGVTYSVVWIPSNEVLSSFTV